jgi:hypothetical protein
MVRFAPGVAMKVIGYFFVSTTPDAPSTASGGTAATMTAQRCSEPVARRCGGLAVRPRLTTLHERVGFMGGATSPAWCRVQGDAGSGVWRSIVVPILPAKMMKDRSPGASEWRRYRGSSLVARWLTMGQDRSSGRTMPRSSERSCSQRTPPSPTHRVPSSLL